MITGNLCCKLNMGVNKLRWVRNCWLSAAFMDDKGVIHIPRPDSWRVGAVLLALASKSSINRFASKELMGSPQLPHVPVYNTYLGILTLECEEGTFRQNSRRVMILWMDREDLLLNIGSYCNLLWMMLRAGFTGTNVNKPFTS